MKKKTICALLAMLLLLAPVFSSVQASAAAPKKYKNVILGNKTDWDDCDDCDDWDDWDDDDGYSANDWFGDSSCSMFTQGWDTVYLGDFTMADLNTITDKDGTIQMEALRKGSTPNTIRHLQTIPADGVTSLEIETALCGVLVEISKTGKFEIDLIGAGKPAEFSSSYERDGGELTLRLTGSKVKGRFISLKDGDLINVIRVGIPADQLKKIEMDSSSGITVLSSLNLPVEGGTTNGTILIRGDTLQANCTLTSQNGAIRAEGKEITGSMHFSTKNGSVLLKADVIRGPQKLEAQNGSVKVDAGTLGDAVMSAKNGSVKGIVGTIDGTVDARVSNGSLKFELTKKPVNLTFVYDGPGYFPKNGSLPTGWEKGIKLGNGIPKLTLGCKNGTLECTTA